jgi:hypothetical protein
VVLAQEQRMHEHEQTGISIWFFIGTLLTIYGALILGADIFYQGHPASQQVVLSELRVGLWWGVLLLVLGIFYCVRFRPGKG